MAVIQLTNPETGETIFVEDSLIPGSNKWGDQKSIEIDWNDAKRAEVVPVGEDSLKTDVVANAQNQQPAQPARGFTPETQQAFNEANQDLKDTAMVLGVRGNNTGGALRNFAMGAIPGTAEAEAALRASAQKLKDIDPTRNKPASGESWSDAYNKYLTNARESREGYAQSNPNRALALQLMGGVAGAAIPFGAASKIGAINKLGMVGRGAVGGGVSGAAFGFGNSQGGLENRLDAALRGAGIGAGVGGVIAPIAGVTVGGIKNTGSRIARGYGKELPANEVEQFMLNRTLSPTVESRRLSDVLSYGSARGAKEFEKAAYELNNLREAMNTRNVPGSYTGKTTGGTTARAFQDATQVPSLTAAKKKFGEFVENVPTLENPVSPVQSVLKGNPTALKILEDNADEFIIKGDVPKVMDPGSFGYWQKAEQILNKKMPKKYQPNRLTGAKKDTYDAIQEISKTRDNLFPGTRRLNTEYSSAIADQMVADKQIGERLSMMATRQKPQPASSSWAQIADFLFGGARRRGMARELVKEGALRDIASPALQKGVGSTTDSITRMLLNIQ